MNSDMENRDWLNDYMSLQQVNPANPFIVPAGYFDDLGVRILSHKNLEELTNDGPSGRFTVPENYFEMLAANIKSRIAVEDALNREDTGFTAPAGYFDRLGEQIKSRILVEEALSNSAEHFTVPEGYFNQLNENILNKTVNTGRADRGAIIRRLYASTVFKYATAACFALVLGGGILLNKLANNPANDHKNSFLHKQLSAVPVDEIKNYLQLNVDAGDAQQTVATEGATVDESSLKDALQNYVDSVQ